jgi:hypothetical protein
MPIESGEAFVDHIWPTTGPHTAESIISAAAAIAELWRYLGHAMQGYAAKVEPLENPADVYTLIGELAQADHRAANILERLGHWSEYVASRSMGTDHYGHTDDDGAPDTVQSTMNNITRHLRDASAAHVTSAESLDRAHNPLSYVYLKDTE